MLNGDGCNRVGHDNSGGGAAWFLDNVEIDCPSLGRTWFFPCKRWLSESKDDGEIERDLVPQELETAQYKPCEFFLDNDYNIFFSSL